jgi:hypothetical protein
MPVTTPMSKQKHRIVMQCFVVGRVGIEPTTIGLKDRSGRLFRMAVQKRFCIPKPKMSFPHFT